MIYLFLILEMLSILYCIHSIFGEKFRFNAINTIFLVVTVAILAFINIYHLKNIYSIIVWLLFLIYGKIRFHEKFGKVILGIIFTMTIITIAQFGMGIFMEIFAIQNTSLRSALINAGVLFLSVLLLSRMKLQKYFNLLYKKIREIYWLFFPIICGIFLMLVIGKLERGFEFGQFFIIVSLAAALLYSLSKWLAKEREKEELSQEIKINEEYQSSYQNLVDDVLVKQHNFRNQMTTILGMHYVYETYEELVQQQDYYWGKIKKDNKYNKLLCLGNHVITGFLYQKFLELETDGIEITYKVAKCSFQTKVPDQYMIEMIGILIDNAAEAAKEREKKIMVEILEEQDFYLFRIKNLMEYVTDQTITEWFEKGNSKKGKQRGIGLFRLKQLCKELKCEILVQNVLIDEKNGIEFTLMIPKE